MYVYILTNLVRSVLYIGVTNSIEHRIIQHWKNRGLEQSFTGRYHIYHLIYYETFRGLKAAISREKELKGWSRARKMALINTMNPEWRCMNKEVLGYWPPVDQ